MFPVGCEVSCLQGKRIIISKPFIGHNSNNVLSLGCFVVEKAIVKTIGYMKDL